MKVLAGKTVDWPLTLLGVVILCLVNLNLVYNWLQQVDYSIYDKQLQSLAIAADEKILIVEIDEQSLTLLGQWPWPRSYHGQVIELLTQADAGVIAYNVVFSNWNGDAEDQLLASAIEKSGRTILPLYFDRVLKQGAIEEIISASQLSDFAGLGHVNSYLDSDGKLRSIRLIDQLSNHKWPHFSYASYLFNQPYSPLLERDLGEVLIPFTSVGDYQRVSFVDLLTGQVPAEIISQRSVFVGVTATSMGDPLSTPVDEDGRQTPAVDINANIYQALESSAYILPLPVSLSVLINTVFALLTLLLIPRLSGIQQVGLTLFSVISVWSLSFYLMRYGYWYSTAGLLLALITIPFIWNLLRLSRLFNYFRNQLARLKEQQAAESFRLPGQNDIKNEDQITVIMSLMGISDYQLLAKDVVDLKTAGLSLDSRTGLKKCLTLFINGMEKQLMIRFEQFTSVEQRKLSLLQSLLAVNNDSKDDHHESRFEVTDVFNKQLMMVDSFQQQLNRSHSLFESSIEGVAAGILIVDLYGNTLFSNASLIKLTGQEIVSVRQLFSSIRLLNTDWIELLQEVVILQESINVEAKSGDKDLSISIRCIDFNSALSPLIAFNVSDITEIKQAHKSRSEMIDFLSHDLRSPMASLQALVSQVRSSHQADGALLEVIEKDDHYSQKGLNFAEQFLELAKVEGLDDIPLYEVDLYSICQNAVDSVYHQGQEKSILVDLQVDDEVWVFSNGELLERVVLNLLTNAIKYSPSKSKVLIIVKVISTHVCVEVIDQGPGIPADLAQNLFKSYTRGKDGNTQQAKGVGLGLRFVDVALKRLHSQIEFESSQDGTRFYFSLDQLDIS